MRRRKVHPAGAAAGGARRSLPRWSPASRAARRPGSGSVRVFDPEVELQPRAEALFAAARAELVELG